MLQPKAKTLDNTEGVLLPKSKSPSLSLSSYTGRGDPEVMPQGLPSPIGPQSGNVTGVAGNHSSQTMSVADAGHPDAEGAQWDDDEDYTTASGGDYAEMDPSRDDPNISGPHPTQPLVDWKAGAMGKWDENDCYREFTYDTSNTPDSRLLSGYCYPTGYKTVDGDYDDNGGMDKPPMVDFTDAQQYEFGNDTSKPQGDWSGGEGTIGSIAVMPVVRR